MSFVKSQARQQWLQDMLTINLPLVCLETNQGSRGLFNLSQNSCLPQLDFQSLQK